MDDAVREAWNARYRERDQLWIGEPDSALVRLVTRERPSNAVDLGAGEGRNALWLAAAGVETTAVDVSDVALERLRAQAKARGLELKVTHASIEEFARSSDERFELVLLANMHPPRAERRGLHELAYELVEPGGRLVIIGHHIAGCGIAGPSDPDRLLSEEEVRATFAPDEVELLEVVEERGDHGHVAPSLIAVVRRQRSAPVP